MPGPAFWPPIPPNPRNFRCRIFSVGWSPPGPSLLDPQKIHILPLRYCYVWSIFRIAITSRASQLRSVSCLKPLAPLPGVPNLPSTVPPASRLPPHPVRLRFTNHFHWKTQRSAPEPTIRPRATRVDPPPRTHRDPARHLDTTGSLPLRRLRLPLPRPQFPP